MILFFAILIVVSILSTKISSRYALPLLIIFILLGLITGSDVLNLFYFDDAILTKKIADILLIFIIFDGGFRISKKDFIPVAGPALTLATLGVALTALVLGIFIHLIMKIDFVYSMMIASIISSTDAAAVFMITKQNPLRSRLSATLSVESAANDPMAILLTLTFIQVLTSGASASVLILLKLMWKFAGGIAVGFVVYKAALLVFERLNSDNRGNYSVLILGFILLCYGAADAVGGNGIISVFFMGYWLGNGGFPAKKSVSNFLESVSTMCNVTLFIMLGLLAFPSRFIHIWKEGLIIAAVMMFVARPAAVFLSTLPFKYSIKEKAFLSWGGIKGAVPIVLATYPSFYNLDERGIVFDIIFFAVFLSCVIQGTTLGGLSGLLKLADKKKPVSPYTVELHSTSKSDIDMFEIHIEHDALCVGRKISELNLDHEMLITSIIRNERIIFPRGNVTMQTGDIVYVLAPADKIDEISKKLTAC